MFGNKMTKVARATEKNKPSVLIGLLTDKDEAVRVAAIDGLGKLKSNDAMNHLINMLHDESAEIRKHAATSLSMIGDVHSKAHISFAAEKETDPATKAAMRDALQALKDY